MLSRRFYLGYKAYVQGVCTEMLLMNMGHYWLRLSLAGERIASLSRGV